MLWSLLSLQPLKGPIGMLPHRVRIGQRRLRRRAGGEHDHTAPYHNYLSWCHASLLVNYPIRSSRLQPTINPTVCFNAPARTWMSRQFTKIEGDYGNHYDSPCCSRPMRPSYRLVDLKSSNRPSNA